MHEQALNGPVVLSEQRHVRYVQLVAEYGDDPQWHVAIKRTEVAYDGTTTSIYRMSSDESPVTCHLSDEAFDLLVAGRLRYLIDKGMATCNPLLEAAFTAYVQACEVQACQVGAGDLPPFDDHPF